MVSKNKKSEVVSKNKKSEGFKSSKKQIEMQQAALPLVNLLAGFGSQMAMGPLADKLRGLPSVPLSMRKNNIDDLKAHVDNIALKPQDKRTLNIIGRDVKRILDSKRFDIGDSPAVDAKMKDLADLSESMLQEKGLKGKVQVNLKGGLGKNYYNPISKSVNIGTAAPSVALHEIGHAADYKNSLAKTVARKLPHMAAMVAVPASFGYGDYIKEKIPGSVDDKVIDFIKEHPYATTLAGYGSSTLYPEGKASFLAWKHMKKHRDLAYANKAALRELAPAFGTYTLGALPALAVAGAAKYLYDRSKKKPLKKKAGAVGDFYKAVTTDPVKKERFLRGFATGAAMGGLGLGGYAAYRTGSKGGNLMSEIDQNIAEENIRRDPLLSREHKRKVIERGRKSIEWQEKHPMATSAIAGGVGALGLGTLMGYLHHDMDLLKNLKKLKR